MQITEIPEPGLEPQPGTIVKLTTQLLCGLPAGSVGIVITAGSGGARVQFEQGDNEVTQILCVYYPDLDVID